MERIDFEFVMDERVMKEVEECNDREVIFGETTRDKVVGLCEEYCELFRVLEDDGKKMVVGDDDGNKVVWTGDKMVVIQARNRDAFFMKFVLGMQDITGCNKKGERWNEFVKK